MFGVTANGFVRKDRDTIVADLEARFKDKFGDNFDVSPSSPDGQVIGIMSEFLSEAWKMGEDAFNSYNPATAYGVSLDNAVRLNDVTRVNNKPTEAIMTLDGTNGTLVPAGSIIETADQIQFVTQSDVTLPAQVTAVCSTDGAIPIAANQINVIVTAITGWTSATNADDAITGVLREQDAALRARRERSVVRTGRDTAEAITSAVGELNVNRVLVIDNDTAGVVDGVPANSIHTIVDGGAEDEIARKIMLSKPLGIPTFGNITRVITDSQGVNKTIRFSRPEAVNLALTITIDKHDGAVTNAGDLVKQAVLDHLQTLSMGDDVVWSRLFSPANSIDRVDSVNIQISVNGGGLNEDSVIVSESQKISISLDDITIVEV